MEEKKQVTPLEAYEAASFEGKRGALFDKMFDAVAERLISKPDGAEEEIFKGMNPVLVREALAGLATVLLSFSIMFDDEADERETFDAFVLEVRRRFLADLPELERPVH